MYTQIVIYIYISSQIIATSHDLTPNGEIPLFQENLGWWNIIIWPDIIRPYQFGCNYLICHLFWVSESILFLVGEWHDTVDGWNSVNSPVEAGSLSYYLQGFIHFRWLAGFQPSTVLMIIMNAVIMNKITLPSWIFMSSQVVPSARGDPRNTQTFGRRTCGGKT